jgi:hypothetical protein
VISQTGSLAVTLPFELTSSVRCCPFALSRGFSGHPQNTQTDARYFCLQFPLFTSWQQGRAILPLYLRGAPGLTYQLYMSSDVTSYDKSATQIWPHPTRFAHTSAWCFVFATLQRAARCRS